MKKAETTIPADAKLYRGKYTNMIKEGSNLVILDPALLSHFPTSESVNRALHAFLAINEQVRTAAMPARSRRRPVSSVPTEFDPRVGTRAQASR